MVDIIYSASAAIALLALVLAFLRMLKGPTAADRVVALDAMTIISISIIVYVASTAGRLIYMDAALVYGLVSFIGVVAVARYLEKGI